ncbi:MAG: DEAD/DEAH box helicase [Castellaniella sp.]|uniref:DEAD/DEAH box helicase n=3 Tax=Castellaniella sp. TaxID=1955812 RepID=UPI003C73369A
MSFDSLGLGPQLVAALRDLGIDTPTSVQSAAIPQALAGHDLMVSSQTGSGKTAAFMLPALQHLSHRAGAGGRGVQVLVLTPTRELAMQVADAARSYGKQIDGLRIATVVGGMPYGAQIKSLSRRVDVLVATPGRLIDHLEARRVNLSTVQTLVLDEADRMLDMGFIEDIETIVRSTPDERQTLLFSATLDGTVAHLAANLMREPQRIEITTHRQKHTNITQHLLYADDKAHKLRLLDHLLRDASLDQAIVFTATKRGADDLADHLSDEGFAAAALHGDMNQRQRTRTLGLMQKGQVRVLVATDVAARGIDVQTISHAVNYDLPLQAEDYVHRIGRTGRAGRDGQAITLAVHAERHKVRRIEHFIGQAIPMETIPGLEPQRSVRPTYKDRPARGARPQGGKPWHKDGPSGAAPRGRKPWQQDALAGDDTRPARAPRKPWEQEARADGNARPAHARKPWEQDKPFARQERGEGRPAYARKPWQQEADGDTRPARARKPWEQDKPAFARPERGEGRPFHPKADRAPHGAGPRQSRDGDAPRAARPAHKAGSKPSFKRQDRQDQPRASRPRFA